MLSGRSYVAFLMESQDSTLQISKSKLEGRLEPFLF